MESTGKIIKYLHVLKLLKILEAKINIYIYNERLY